MKFGRSSGRERNVAVVRSIILTLAVTYAIALILFRAVLFNPETRRLMIISLSTELIQSTLVAFLSVAVFVFFPARNAIIRWLLAGIMLLVISADILLLYFYMTRKLFFDYFYLVANRGEALTTLVNTYDFFYLRISVGIIIFLALVWLVSQAPRVMAQQVPRLYRYAAVVFLSALLLFVYQWPVTPLKRLVRLARATHHILSLSSYYDYYEASLNATTDGLDALEQAPSIILMQLESVNSEFINQTVTPQMISLAQDGVLFMKHHSNSVQTRRSQVVTTCSQLPSLSISVRRVESGRTVCLPSVLNQLGYTTIFVKNFNLGFQGIDELARTAGYDIVLGPEIMHEDDPQLKWGYREDIFFQRVSEYITEHYEDNTEPLFVHISAGASNHYDFRLSENDIRRDVYASLPATTDESYLHRRQNSIYTQDAYLADFLQMIRSSAVLNDSEIIVHGDHPVGLYRGNLEASYNAESFDQKTFYTGLAYIPSSASRDDIAVGTIIDRDVGSSNQGIAPTILELLGVENVFPTSKSFYRYLIGGDTAARCVVNVQPYFHPAIALVEYPHKVVLQLIEGKISYTDLTGATPDTDESYEEIYPSLDRASYYLDACLTDTLSDAVVDVL